MILFLVSPTISILLSVSFVYSPNNPIQLANIISQLLEDYCIIEKFLAFYNEIVIKLNLTIRLKKSAKFSNKIEEGFQAENHFHQNSFTLFLCIYILIYHGFVSTFWIKESETHTQTVSLMHEQLFCLSNFYKRFQSLLWL